MQQAQVNLLADMGAQPTTLMPGLVAATKSTDTAGPTVTITARAGAAQANGAQVTVTGTAADAGGGGSPASRSPPTAAHLAPGDRHDVVDLHLRPARHGQHAASRCAPSTTAPTSAQPSPASFAVTCPCSVFGPRCRRRPRPTTRRRVELGLRFTPSCDGFVTGVRFYKGAGNTGTHVGSLWSTERRSGWRRSRSANESATGWQTATFATPVAVSRGQTYVVSYTPPTVTTPCRPTPSPARDRRPTRSRSTGGFGATPAGVFADAGRFPSASFRRANYFVDALFTTVDESPLIATNQWPLAGSSSVPSDTTVSATFSKPVGRRHRRPHR